MQSDSETKTALQEAKQALEHALQREHDLRLEIDDRIAQAAHDIKNPLSPMIGITSLMLNKTAANIPADELDKHISIIHRGCLRLLEICESLLTMDKPVAATEPQEVNVGDMLTEISDLYQEQVEARGLKLTTSISDDFPTFHTVPQFLYRVLTNLVSNAVKFTPSGGNIALDAHLEESDDAVILVVRDSGEGISAGNILKILNPGGRTESLHGDEGTGLGLVTVNRIMTYLGGEMGISSDEETGTRVTLRFPKEALSKP